MKNSCLRSSSTIHLAVMLLFVLLAGTIPAAATTYNYTGKPYTKMTLDSFDPAVPPGDHLTISFTYNGSLSTVLFQNLILDGGLSAFTMTSGNVSINLNNATSQKRLEITNVSNGRPTSWAMHLMTGDSSNGYYFQSSPALDENVQWHNGSPNIKENSFQPGVWSISLPTFKILPGFSKWIIQLLAEQSFDLKINNIGGDPRNYVYVGVADPNAPGGVRTLQQYLYNVPGSGFQSGVAMRETVSIPPELQGLNMEFITGLQLFDRSNPDIEISGLGTPIPVPGAVWLLGSGLVGLMGLRRWRRN